MPSIRTSLLSDKDIVKDDINLVRYACYYVLTLSDFRTYIYVRNSQTVATPVRTDFAIEIWGFNRRLTTPSTRGVHVLPLCSWQPFYSKLTNGRKVEFTRSCPLFLASFGKLRLSDQVQFIAWYGIQRRIIWIYCRESEVSG